MAKSSSSKTNRSNGTSNSKKTIVRQQPKKDSKSKRVNFDNARESRVEQQIKQDSKKYNANDASEYSRNPELLRSAGSIPFATILGSTLYDTASGQPNNVPGVMSLGFVPAFGPGGRPVALNQAGDSYYSYVVHANSRNTSYTAPDLMVLTVAGMQVFSALGAAIRAYGVVKAYTEVNAYIPDALLRAMGFNPIYVRGNLAQMWFDINNLINQSRQIWVPNTFPLMQHWFRMNSNVYTDSEGLRSQIYVPVQDRYYIYSETSVKTGSCLLPVSKSGKPWQPGDTIDPFSPATTLYTWSEWRDVIQGMIDALINSEDRGVIYGDILKAYGAEKLYALPPLDVDYTVYPDYNAEFLTQIENTNFADKRTCPIGLVQNEEDLYPIYEPYNPTTLSFTNVPALNPIMNFHIATQPTPEMVMIASRNMLSGLKSNNGECFSLNVAASGSTLKTSDAFWYPDCCGSEIFTLLTEWNKPFVSTVGNGGITIAAGRYLSPGNPAGNALRVLDLMAFDWHPFIYDLSSSYNQLTTQSDLVRLGGVTNAYGDFDNYTMISSSMLKKLHDVAMYSLYGVPQV